ncbi:MAG: hypothetical protein H6Q21_2572 [Bacteroidetes bacterium]|jgi:hypothetical protein|nr:hypothetical protein [Bacteroidota bacterium]
MIESYGLPGLLAQNLGSEKRDFAVMATRSQPLKMSLAVIVFGTIWLAFTSIFVIAFLGPVFAGREVHFLSNDVPVVAGPGNLRPLLLPALIIGIFVLVGLGMLSWGLRMLLKKGGYFVGTPTRLVHFSNGTIRSIDWEQFSGDIEVGGNEQKGNISLGLRTGKMVSQKNGPDRYVPDTIYISGIPDVFKVEQICRMRIKENDPTPSPA